jgi:hypothetical protein
MRVILVWLLQRQSCCVESASSRSRRRLAVRLHQAAWPWPPWHRPSLCVSSDSWTREKGKQGKRYIPFQNNGERTDAIAMHEIVAAVPHVRTILGNITCVHVLISHRYSILVPRSQMCGRTASKKKKGRGDLLWRRRSSCWWLPTCFPMASHLLSISDLPLHT